MPAGLDATTCGVCGAHLAQESDSCSRCSAPLTGVRPATGTLLRDTVAASSGSRAVAVGTDVVVVVLTFLPGVVVGAFPGAAALGPVVGVTAALVTAALMLRSFRVGGRTPGAVVAHLRYVDAFAGTAPGPGRWPWQQVDAVTLRHRDPLAPIAGTTPVGAPAPSPAPAAAPRAPEPLVPANPAPPPPRSPVRTPEPEPMSERPSPHVPEPTPVPSDLPPTPPPHPDRPSPPPQTTPRLPDRPQPAPPHQQPAQPTAPRPPQPAPDHTRQPARPTPPPQATPQHPDQPTAPRPAQQPAPPRPTPSRDTTGGCYLLSGPARIHVTGTALVGRNPRPNPGEQVDVVVPFGDFDLSISTTHAHLQWDGDICWVTDRGSTNGTSVTTTEGTWRIPPGAQAPARPGDTVLLGSRPFTVVDPG